MATTNTIIRIGTRTSPLALFQAKQVQDALKPLGIPSKLVKVKSYGDAHLEQPIYEMGVQGVFTKTLDLALIKKNIDIAVHSLKDVPTIPSKHILQLAVLERSSPYDVLIKKTTTPLDPCSQLTIGTGSLRRKQQWLLRYPKHTICPIRGNINSRLKKLQNSTADAIILAEAALIRLAVNTVHQEVLDWMIPAPRQGIISIFGLKSNNYINEIVKNLNHQPTAACATVEGNFLRTLEGGCTAPIGAYAKITENTIQFKGIVFGINPSNFLEINDQFPLADWETRGSLLAQRLLNQGAKALIADFKP